MIVLPQKGNSKPIVAIVCDVSGSMSSVGVNTKNALLQTVELEEYIVYIIPFGPQSINEGYGYYGRNISEPVWTNKEQIERDYCTNSGTYVALIDNIRLIPERIDALLFYSDGCFHDRHNYIPLLTRLARDGILSSMKDVMIVFPHHTQPGDINRMTTEWTRFIDAEPNVACNAPYIRNLSSIDIQNPQFLNDIIVQNVENTGKLELADGWLNVAGIVGFDPTQPAYIIAQEWDKIVGLTDQILEKMMNMVKYNPQILVSKDPKNPWVLVHKILYLTSAKQRYIERLMHYREAKDTPIATKNCIKEMQKRSFISDKGAVVNTSKRLFKYLGMYLYSNAKISEDIVIDAVGSKNYTFLIRDIFKGGLIIGDGSIRQDGTVPAVPIIDSNVGADCRHAMGLFLSQFCSSIKITGDALMVLILEVWNRIDAMSCSDREKIKPFEIMVIRALKDEPWLTSMMGWNAEKKEFVFEDATLLFSWNNANCFTNFLRKLRKECFGCYKASGKEIVPFIKIEELYYKFRKITNWQKVLTVIRGSINSFTIKRDFKRLHEGSATPYEQVLTSFTPYQIIDIPDWNSKKYVNVPTMAVVLKAVEKHSHKKNHSYLKMFYQQLDLFDPPIADMHSNDIKESSSYPDTRTYTRCPDGYRSLNLHSMLDGTNSDEHLKKVLRLSHFLQGLNGTIAPNNDVRKFLKETGNSIDFFSEDSDYVDGVLKTVFDWIQTNICVPEAAKFYTETETIKVSPETVIGCIHIPENLIELIKSGNNPNMKQAIESLDSKTIAPHNVGFHTVDSRNVKTFFRLTDAEMKNISDEIRSRISSCFNIEGAVIAEERTCMLCFDGMSARRADDEWECCPIAVCRRCRDEYAVEYRAGDVLRRSHLACPNCYKPIITGNTAIDSFLKSGTDRLVNDVCRICDHCHNVFAQPNPECGQNMTIEQLTSATCERCSDEQAANLAGDGVVWNCPHGDCGMSGKKESGCDYMRCPRCKLTSCASCSCPFTYEQDVIINGDWQCLSDCTPEYIDEYIM